jgi:hypothetical protein
LANFSPLVIGASGRLLEAHGDGSELSRQCRTPFPIACVQSWALQEREIDRDGESSRSSRVNLERPNRVRLVQQLDGIAFAKHSFREYCAIDTGHSFVRLRDGFQNRGRFLRSVGIEGDHHASRIALEDCDGHV